FSDEPVSGGIFIPGTGDILYTQGRGGDENYQVFRLDRKLGRSTLLSDGRSRNGLGPVSRAGDRVVLSSNRRNGKDTDLYLLDFKTGATRTLLETHGEFWVADDWSPDDSKLLLNRVVSVNESHPGIFDFKLEALKTLPGLGPEKSAAGSLRFLNAETVAFASD